MYNKQLNTITFNLVHADTSCAKASTKHLDTFRGHSRSRILGSLNKADEGPDCVLGAKFVAFCTVRPSVTGCDGRTDRAKCNKFGDSQSQSLPKNSPRMDRYPPTPVP